MTEQDQKGSTEPAAQSAGNVGHEENSSHPGGSHGHSVAAWVAVSVVALGCLVMSIAVLVTTLWIFIVGAVVVVLGGISGKVLHVMGFGDTTHDQPPTSEHRAVR